MSPSRFRIARDYNQGLPLPVRVPHLALAALRDLLSPITTPLSTPARRAWAWPLALGVVGIALFLPLDGPINRLVNPAHYVAPATAPIRLGGDFRREAEFIQQYGQFTCTAIAIILILLLDRDRARLRRIADWLAGAIVALIAVNFLKMTIGRPRPKFDDPWGFLGPAGTYAVRPEDPAVGLRHAWEFWGGISSDLWSMPSSHTAYAVVMSFALAALYPRLRGFAIVMAVLVGVCRVLLNSHYPSDVIAGATLGYLAASAAFRHRWGQRFLDSRARASLPAARAETGPLPP
ncbi:MAG: phosphatase PAP2 family protein [Phycisphaerales bacterium]|nr:phosphatase PAP2 family protein [Phycisphaerales bacterium]